MTEPEATLPFFKIGEVPVAPAALEAVLNPGRPSCCAAETDPCMYVKVLPLARENCSHRQRLGAELDDGATA